MIGHRREYMLPVASRSGPSEDRREALAQSATRRDPSATHQLRRQLAGREKVIGLPLSTVYLARDPLDTPEEIVAQRSGVPTMYVLRI